MAKLRKLQKAMKAGGWDYAKIADLSEIQVTAAELAAVIGGGVTAEDVYSEAKRCPEFRAAWRGGKKRGQMSLRRAMWNKAMDGDTRMQIWLSKQYLKMREDNRLQIEQIDKTQERIEAMSEDELLSRYKEIASNLAPESEATH